MDERDAFEPLRSRSGGVPYAPAPTGPAMPTYAPAAQTVQKRGFGLGAVVGTAGTALALGVGIGYVAFHSAPAKPAPTAAAAASATTSATIRAHGSLTLNAGTFLFQNESSTTCVSRDGYSDITAGAAVTIGDQSGQTIGVAQLGAGRLMGGADAHTCQFDYSAQVAAGKSLYTVTISHRGTQTFSPGLIDTGFDMSLG